MRPLKLRVRGLRSFATETEIDLARLGEEGLFAIHGPTGAGKSSLLDGIFLALFGRTPRGEASECVTTGAFELAVRLELELTHGPARRVLGVERAWRWGKKRGAEAGERGAPRHPPVRIEERSGSEAWHAVDLGGRKPEQYLAEEVVRVGFGDFQQAVVLPQGEFDALLRAKPTERRSLVATLFRTEHLGDPLYQVVRARQDAIEREIAGLAEALREVFASDDDVRAAREAGAAARARATELAAELALAERAASERRQARARVEARDAARAALETKAAELAARAGDRERIARARRALGAAAAIAELERRAAAARDAARSAADAAERSGQAEARRGRAASELVAATSAHDDALPGLLEDLGKARLAITRARELGAVEADRDARREALARRDEGLASLRASVARAAGELERAQAGARDAERRLEELRVSEGERARVMAELAVAELAAAEQGVVTAIRLQREAAATRVGEREAAVAAEERRASELEAALGELAAAARARAVDADRAASELARAGKALDDARRSAAAAELADRLRDGDPCPVCGACEHPGADHLGATIAVDACERTLDAARRMAKAAERERDEAERVVAAQDEALRAAAVRAGEEAQALEAARRELAAFDAPAARGKKRGRAAGAETGPPETPAIAMARAQARKHAERVELALAGLLAAERERCLARGKAQEVAAVEAAAHALLRRGRDAEAVEQKLREARARADGLAAERAAAESTLAAAAHERVEAAAAASAVESLAAERRTELAALVGAERARDPAAWARSLEERRERLASARDAARASAEALAAAAERLALEARAAASRREQADAEAARARQAADEAVARAGFTGPEELCAARMEPRSLEAMAAALDLLEAEVARRRAVLDERARDVDVEVSAEEALAAEQARDALRAAAGQAAEAASAAQTREAELERRRQRSTELSTRVAELEPRARRLGAIRQVVASKQLAEAAAERHLEAVTRSASALLGSLSGQRYSLVRTADGGFAVADADGGGVVRAPSTLSGGETFLVSLALALALSERIQLAGRTRFDFFFLDEGFGSLDPATLDVALSALERLRGPHRVIGMISHVGSIEERMPRKLRVTPARPGRAASVLHEP